MSTCIHNIWFHQGLQLFLINKIKFFNKIEKVLVARIHMSFLQTVRKFTTNYQFVDYAQNLTHRSNTYKPLKVMNVDMNEYPKQPCQNLLA